MFWNTSQFTKQLHIKNPGSVDCFVHWTKQDDLLETFYAPSSADTTKGVKIEQVIEDSLTMSGGSGEVHVIQ